MGHVVNALGRLLGHFRRTPIQQIADHLQTIRNRPMNAKITDKRRLLKIKIKSLAAEARIIHQEERKVKKQYPHGHPLREQMYLHRIREVREECRASLLAYNFIRGRTYAQTEANNHSYGMGQDTFNWSQRLLRASTMVSKYGPPTVTPSEAINGLKAWITESSVVTAVKRA
jgi:hypothetical protein